VGRTGKSEREHSQPWSSELLALFNCAEHVFDFWI